MMSSFKAEEKQRRHQIGLDHLTDEEISRLVSGNTETNKKHKETKIDYP
jgi:2-oxo-4-hydroxy-4-carboxy--5-ureidoimidazoline (OHCU) decarboxylase